MRIALVLLFGLSCWGCSTDGAISSSPAAPRSLAFPPGFVWGVATSAYQIEGNSPNNDYDVWNNQGNGRDRNGRASNSYVLYDLDAKLAADLGVKAFRLGIEWARIEPYAGQVSSVEVAHYRNVLLSLKAHGLKPYVTLHHYVNPLWFAAKGGWLAPTAATDFERHARRMAALFGDLVDEWMTFNEPVYLVAQYTVAAFPDGDVLAWDKLGRAAVNMVRAHAAAYDAIKEADTIDADGDGSPARVASVNALSPMEPADAASAADVAAARRFDAFYNKFWLNAWVKGELDADFDGVPDGAPDPSLINHEDYLSINYYTRQFVRNQPGAFGKVSALPCMFQILCSGTLPTHEAGTNGSEFYPQGLYDLIAEYSRYGLPILITENGVATEDGETRARYIKLHLAEVHRALADGYHVEGYLYWSLLDNFEWLYGYSQRFGLYTVDFATFSRTLNAGGAAYRDIVKSNRVELGDLP